MKKEHIVRFGLKEIAKLPDRSDWKRLRAMKEKDIDVSDIPPLDSGFWDLSSLRLVVPPAAKKRAVTLRLKPDVVKWFKNQGKGHVSLMQAILERFAEMNKGHAPQ